MGSTLAVLDYPAETATPGAVRRPSLPPPLDPDSRIRRAQALMRRNLHRRVRIAELAAAAGLSVSRFSHLFTNETGIPPARYLKVLRLEMAKELLEGSRLSVKQVAVRVCLDASRLTREFRKTYGLTPSQYRRLGWLPFEGRRAASSEDQLPSSSFLGSAGAERICADSER